MPIYEYQCNACGHQFELIQKVSDPVTTSCQACKADAAKRLVSATSFRLKGSGWYETDFKNKSNKVTKPVEATSDKAKEPATTPKDPATTSSKSAEKPTTSSPTAKETTS